VEPQQPGAPSIVRPLHNGWETAEANLENKQETERCPSERRSDPTSATLQDRDKRSATAQPNAGAAR
jgi:hypothetical protein